MRIVCGEEAAKAIGDFRLGADALAQLLGGDRISAKKRRGRLRRPRGRRAAGFVVWAGFQAAERTVESPIRELMGLEKRHHAWAGCFGW